eukprot:m.36336 g.36336  ORF g.36336 m.36336 type:complete len:52 (+) comp17336_c0_seq1:1344-1499(+)
MEHPKEDVTIVAGWGLVNIPTSDNSQERAELDKCARADTYNKRMQSILADG